MDRRLELARSFRDRTRDAAAGQVKRALEAKELSPDDPQSAEEWLAGPLISLRTMRMLIETLEEIREHGHPECSVAELRRRAGGQGQQVEHAVGGAADGDLERDGVLERFLREEIGRPAPLGDDLDGESPVFQQVPSTRDSLLQPVAMRRAGLVRDVPRSAVHEQARPRCSGLGSALNLQIGRGHGGIVDDDDALESVRL